MEAAHTGDRLAVLLQQLSVALRQALTTQLVIGDARQVLQECGELLEHGARGAPPERCHQLGIGPLQLGACLEPRTEPTRQGACSSQLALAAAHRLFGVGARVVGLQDTLQLCAHGPEHVQRVGEALPEGTPDFVASKSDALLVTVDDKGIRRHQKR